MLFETLRKYISLVTLVNPKYTCDLLLYGDSKYQWDTNKEIIKAVKVNYVLEQTSLELILGLDFQIAFLSYFLLLHLRLIFTFYSTFYLYNIISFHFNKFLIIRTL